MNAGGQAGLLGSLRQAVHQRGSGSGGDVSDKLGALHDLVEAGTGVLDPAALAEAGKVADKAESRLRMSAEHTVVALCGATGSGKSSLFNTLTGLDLAEVGRLRPMTTQAMSCTWGSEPAGELLEWLGIPSRHQFGHSSALSDKADDELNGLILLDLPDHDSTVVEHQLVVDRLVQLVDVMVWVVDPQKYADALLHDRYIRPFAAHDQVMVFVLNRADELSTAQLDACLADLRRILADDGVREPTIVPTSVPTGHGVADLRKLIAARVRAKAAARQRASADLARTGNRLAVESGTGRPAVIEPRQRKELTEALLDASGANVVVDALERAYTQRCLVATGWPLTKWITKLRPDPLKRLHLDLGLPTKRKEMLNPGQLGAALTVARTSLPAPTPVQRARMDTAVRTAASQASEGLPQVWSDAVRRGVREHEADLGDRLDEAIGRTDLGILTPPAWWMVARALQWMVLTFGVLGGVWLLLRAAIPSIDAPRMGAFSVPFLVVVGAVVIGVLLDLVFRFASRVGGQRRGAVARRALTEQIDQVAEQLVWGPAAEAVQRYETCRRSLAVLTN